VTRVRATIGVAAFVLMTSHTIAQTTAQTAAADGVDAFLRADYSRAVAILQPLAERPWLPDHTAEFFMGALYDDGFGVPADPLRACAMYIRASGDRDSAISAVASELVRARQRSLGHEVFTTCNWHANVGFDHRFDPVTIALDQGHWIAWDLKGATVTYRGVDKRRELPLASRGAVFLPLRHTELATGDARSDRRHFIELFKWEPLGQPRSWRLLWILFEVVGEELISVASEPLLTASGDTPPTGDQDVEANARLGVNDRGDAEWTIVSGPTPRNAVIESEADRQERRAAAQQARDRQAEAARIDTSRRYDVRRLPELAYPEGNAGGCSDVLLYGWTRDRSEAISALVSKSLLQGSMTASFDLTAQRPGLEVLLHVYERAITESLFCTDVFTLPRPKEEVWRAVGGTLSIQLFPPGIPGRPAFMYRVVIRISGAQFVSGSGARVNQAQPITLTGIVGWIPG